VKKTPTSTAYTARFRKLPTSAKQHPWSSCLVCSSTGPALALPPHVPTWS